MIRDESWHLLIAVLKPSLSVIASKIEKSDVDPHPGSEQELKLNLNPFVLMVAGMGVLSGMMNLGRFELKCLCLIIDSGSLFARLLDDLRDIPLVLRDRDDVLGACVRRERSKFSCDIY